MSESGQTAKHNDGGNGSLMVDRSFWGIISTQFLGAFNDNLYKQLMLLLAVPVVAAAASAQIDASSAAGDAPVVDVQGWATFVFSIPFVLFSGIAGYLSDRYQKTPIIVWCKVAEIAIMLLGLGAFYYYDLLGYVGTWIVLFLMGTQSAFFGPGKYGVLPELFQAKDLPRANGLILMTTFLAIIFGTVSAGALKDALSTGDSSVQGLWIGQVVCVLIAVAGTATSLFVRRTAAAEPNAKLSADNLGISGEIWRLLQSDRKLLGAVLVSSVFWLISGLTVPTVNRLGLDQLNVDATRTSILTASIGFGIMGGALIASWLCRKGWGKQCINIGLGGIFIALVLLGFWRGDSQLIGFGGSIATLLGLGVAAAIFSIPVQVFLQERPPSQLKGRMIATMNQANFIGIVISGPLYQLFERLSSSLGWPISSVFWMMGLLVLPLAIFYRLDVAVKEK